MKRYKVLIADDHAIVLDGLRHMLEKDFDVIGCAEDGRTLAELC
jgi:DNA-binding NarL/FixJ family response regulator